MFYCAGEFVRELATKFEERNYEVHYRILRAEAQGAPRGRLVGGGAGPSVVHKAARLRSVTAGGAPSSAAGRGGGGGGLTLSPFWRNVR